MVVWTVVSILLGLIVASILAVILTVILLYIMGAIVAIFHGCKVGLFVKMFYEAIDSKTREQEERRRNAD